MTRPRLTIRRLMVVVVIAGLGFGVEAYRRHLVHASSFYRRAATSHHFEAMTQDHNVKMSELGLDAVALFPGTGAAGAILDEVATARCRRLIAHHRQLAEKYERAARCPWLPVAPDPPEPE